MLYRRHLRIKALQSLYAYYSGGQEDIVTGEKQLLTSINKVYELFVYQLSFLHELKRFASNLNEDRKKKFFPSEEELNPNLKFINNKVLEHLANNNDLAKKEVLYKINWADDQDMIRNFYHKLNDADFFKIYMENDKFSMEEDKKLIIKIVDRVMASDEVLNSFYSEKSVYFVDGLDLVNILLIKFTDTIGKKSNEFTPLPPLLKTENDAINTDLQFVRKLYRKVIVNNKANDEIIKPKTINWEYDRIPVLDLILIKMAITEFEYMDEVPVKVTLNEYIELSKYFSITKSRTFVNGILDKLITELKEQGRIKKIGAGMIDK
jgi:N utilization substance protein B